MAAVRQGTLCPETCRQLVTNNKDIQNLSLTPRFQSRVLPLMMLTRMLLCLKQVEQGSPAKVKTL